MSYWIALRIFRKPMSLDWRKLVGEARPFSYAAAVCAVALALCLELFLSRVTGLGPSTTLFAVSVAVSACAPPPAKLTLDVVAMRTRNAIIRDWSFVARLGEWLGRTTAAHWHWPPSSAFAAIAGFTRHQSREDE